MAGRFVRRSISFSWLMVWIFLAPRSFAQDWTEVEGLKLRAAVGAGYGVGSNNGSYKVDHGTLDLESVTGGSGPVLSANLWLDRVLTPNFSVGIEFLRLMNTATANLDLPKGISILTDPTSGRARLSASADMAFIDLAFRRELSDPRMAFYIGGGVGGGSGKASAGFQVYNPATGSFSQQSSVNSAVGGAHGLLGVDFYLTKSIFISVSPQLLYMTGHPIGVRQSYLDMMVTSSVGFSFY